MKKESTTKSITEELDDIYTEDYYKRAFEKLSEEYESIHAENKKIQDECRWKDTERSALIAELEATRRENDTLEAQLSIVRLIFGGR